MTPRDRLIEILRPRKNWHPDDLADAADAILADTGLLDDICEYRARQINAAVDTITRISTPPRHWESVYDIPFDVPFWGVLSVGQPLEIQPAWQRLTHDTCLLRGGFLVEGSRDLDAKYPNGFSEVQN